MAFRTVLFGMAVTGFSFGLGSPIAATAQTCRALALVGGQGSQVTKTVSAPTVPVPLPGPLGTVVRNNWNTDWVVGSQDYRQFVITLVPQKSGLYDIDVYLKYPDQTADKAYSRIEQTLTAQRSIRITASPRTALAPYQVNVRVGGVKAVGNRYSVSVSGCR